MRTKILILLAGVALLAACGRSHKSEYEVANSSAADTLGKADSIAKVGSKLIKTAGMRFKVKSVQQTGDSVAALTTRFRGVVMHHEMGSVPESSHDMEISNDSVMRITAFSTTADITVKIPSDRLEEFMSQVGRMGIYVNDRKMDITDKSFDYLSAQLKLRGRAELISQQRRGKIIVKHPEDVLALKDDMIDEQVGNRQIDDAVKNSIVTLSFYESNTIKKEVVANDNPSAYSLPFFKRIGMAIGNGVNLFADVVVGIANLWVFVLLAIIVWFVIRRYKGKTMIKE
jgi:hypothetical protein